ncbi:MAG TPA: hypothetical protein VGK51_14680 [Actinomycetota bacterium]
MNEHAVRSLISQVETAVSGAIDRALPQLAGADPVVRRSEHADFQSNAALVLAKRARTKPADLAAVVLGSGYPVQFSAGREPTTGPPRWKCSNMVRVHINAVSRREDSPRSRAYARSAPNLG